MNNTWRRLTMDKEDSLVYKVFFNGATNIQTELSNSVCSWSASSSHPALMPDQSGTFGPEPKAEKQNFAPFVALCPPSCFSLSSVFTCHLSITCNRPPLPLFHARLQNQLVCVTLGLRVSPQTFQSFVFVQKQQQKKPATVWSTTAQKWRCCLTVELLSRLSPPLRPFLAPGWICSRGNPNEDAAKSTEFVTV